MNNKVGTKRRRTPKSGADESLEQDAPGEDEDNEEMDSRKVPVTNARIQKTGSAFASHGSWLEADGHEGR